MQVALPDRRSVTNTTPDGMAIVVPAKRNLLILLFIGAWLIGWCFGEVFAARQLLTGTAGGITLFLAAWLIMWTVGGAFASYSWLWTAFGTEVVTLRPGALVLKRDVLGLGRLREFDLAQVKRLRVATRSPNQFGYARSMRPWELTAGLVAFDYGAKTFHFAAGVDEAEAAMIISDLRSRHAFGEV